VRVGGEHGRGIVAQAAGEDVQRHGRIGRQRERSRVWRRTCRVPVGMQASLRARAKRSVSTLG
jgi:hypothetical protein